MKKTIFLLLALAGLLAHSKDAYLFAYFKGEKDGLHLAYSYDGFRWDALNGDMPLLRPMVGKDRLMRDPSICQGPDGMFHMVWTSSWNDKIIGYASSADLVHWSSQRALPVMMHEPTALNAWAPEVTYDDESGEFFIYWATSIPGRHSFVPTSEREKQWSHRIYLTTTKDFKTFSPTRLWFNPDFIAIDSACLRLPEGAAKKWMMVVKNENSAPPEKNLRVTFSDSLVDGFPVEVSAPINFGGEWAEGPSPLLVGNDIFVYFDNYRDKHYSLVVSHDCGATWEDRTSELSLPRGIRHGTAIKVDEKIVDALKRNGGAAERAVSPDGRLEVCIDVDGGRPRYSVAYDGREIVAPSSLGLVCDFADFTKGMKIADARLESFSDNYELATIKKRKVNVLANRLTVDMTNSEGRISVAFHIGNNDVAFRYLLPRQDGRSCVRVIDEATRFSFPIGTTGFVTPQAKPMSAWRRTKPSYEEEYLIGVPLEKAKGKHECGWTFPALFKTPAGWALLGETGTDGGYCACRLGEFEGTTAKIEFPMPGENNGSGTVEPAFALPGTTPWRTISVGATLKPIVETTIPWDVVEPKYERKEYRYGRSTWSWILWMDPSMNWRDQVEYIDFAAAMGYEFILVDAGWDTAKDIGRARMPELVEYAQSKGVGVWLWYSSSGWWNDIYEQGPINVMCDPIKRKRDMKWMRELGVKGIKVDFWGGDKQETMRLYEQVLSDADDNDLMVIFHGCTIPRGWERMYPNYVGSEAVLASENRYFEKHFCDMAGVNATLHPFIRNALGNMEYGGTFLNDFMSRDNKSRHPRGTSVNFELATAVLFQCPVQNFAVAPNNLKDAPADAIEFMRKIPTTWDETRFIDGYPGKFVALARRHGDTWYVAAAASKPVKFTLDMTPFGGEKEEVSLSSNDGLVRTIR